MEGEDNMVSLIDSYSETNQNATNNLAGTTWDLGVGQSFLGVEATLDSAKFYLKKTLAPTGNAVAKLYRHRGTFGSTSLPDGTALVTSDNFDVSTLTTSFALITFNFTGNNRYSIKPGVYYVITLEFSGGDVNNFVVTGHDTSSATHAGVYSRKDASAVWQNVLSDQDLCFYIYGDIVFDRSSKSFYLKQGFQ